MPTWNLAEKLIELSASIERKTRGRFVARTAQVPSRYYEVFANQYLGRHDVDEFAISTSWGDIEIRKVPQLGNQGYLLDAEGGVLAFLEFEPIGTAKD